MDVQRAREVDSTQVHGKREKRPEGAERERNKGSRSIDHQLAL